MKIFIHAILITAVILMAVLALTSEVKTPFVIDKPLFTTSKSEARKFQQACRGIAITKENNGVFALECRK